MIFAELQCTATVTTQSLSVRVGLVALSASTKLSFPNDIVELPAEGTETELPACADEWNQQNGISCEQAHALLMGSMFGCDESGEWPDWAAAAAFKIPQGHCQCVQPAQGPIGGINGGSWSGRR